MTARAESEEQALALVEPVVSEICGVLGSSVYAVTPSSETTMQEIREAAIIIREAVEDLQRKLRIR